MKDGALVQSAIGLTAPSIVAMDGAVNNCGPNAGALAFLLAIKA
jgi:hypothetical protein